MLSVAYRWSCAAVALSIALLLIAANCTSEDNQMVIGMMAYLGLIAGLPSVVIFRLLGGN